MTDISAIGPKELRRSLQLRNNWASSITFSTLLVMVLSAAVLIHCCTTYGTKLAAKLPQYLLEYHL